VDERIITTETADGKHKPSTDAHLARMADRLIEIDQAIAALTVHYDDPQGPWAKPAARNNALVWEWRHILSEIAETQARTPVGRRAKAKAALVQLAVAEDRLEPDEAAIFRSLCEDLLRSPAIYPTKKQRPDQKRSRASSASEKAVCSGNGDAVRREQQPHPLSVRFKQYLHVHIRPLW
jgi:hypothetical protein